MLSTKLYKNRPKFNYKIRIITNGKIASNDIILCVICKYVVFGVITRISPERGPIERGIRVLYTIVL